MINAQVQIVGPDGKLTPAGILTLQSLGGSGSVAWADITGKPSTFTPAAHTHPASEISDSTTAGRAMLTAATATAQTALLDAFTSGAKGLAPASGGGTTNFLRADGAWSKPPGADYAYGHLVADYTLTNTASSQKAFNWSTNGALTLATGKYIFRCYLYLASMSGANLDNLQFDYKGAGTATIANSFFVPEGRDGGSLGAQSISSSGSVTTASAAPIVNPGTGTTFLAVIQGYFDVTATGTIIPSVALTTAAAAVVKAGSAFECIRIGDTGSHTAGSWS